MSLQEIREKRAQLQADNADPITIKVFSIFLQQPNKIGSDAATCVRLNLTNPQHYSIFINAVLKDIERLKSESGFQSHEMIQKTYEEAKTILLK